MMFSNDIMDDNINIDGDNNNGNDVGDEY